MKLLILFWFATLCSAAESPAGTVFFDSASDISDYFTATGTPKFAVGGSNGLAGSTSLTVDTGFTAGSLVTRNGLAGGPENPVLELSLYFLFSAPTANDGGIILTLGMSSNPRFVAEDLGRYGSEIHIYKVPSFTPQYSVSAWNHSENMSSGSLTNISLLDGMYYRMSLSGVWNPDADRYDLSFRVHRSDADGRIGATLFSSAPNWPSGINHHRPIYAFVSSQGPAGKIGIGAIDNFSFTPISIPEPKPAILVALTPLIVSHRRINKVTRA